MPLTSQGAGREGVVAHMRIDAIAEALLGVHVAIDAEDHSLLGLIRRRPRSGRLFCASFLLSGRT